MRKFPDAMTATWRSSGQRVIAAFPRFAPVNAILAIQNTMRKLSALLIAISLFLPLQSCTANGKTSVTYPLSGEPMAMILMAAIYLPPLLVFFLPKYPRISIAIGTLACSAGLYFVTFASTVFATRLLAGWYIYSASSITYIIVSLLELGRIAAAKQLLRRTIVAGPAV